MIIGSGLLGVGFLKSNTLYNGEIIFASGVSNSTEIKAADFDREKALVLKTISEHPERKFIYFSSVLAGISDKPYYAHKMQVEELIKHHSHHYLIFRIPQVIGAGGNKNTLFNYLKEAINTHQPITVYQDAKRALLDIDDLVQIVNYCKGRLNESIIHLSAIEKIEVSELVAKMGLTLNKQPIINYKTLPHDNDWPQENSPIVEEAIAHLGIKKQGYTDKVIKKYIY